MRVCINSNNTDCKKIKEFLSSGLRSYSMSFKNFEAGMIKFGKILNFFKEQEIGVKGSKELFMRKKKHTDFKFQLVKGWIGDNHI